MFPFTRSTKIGHGEINKTYGASESNMCVFTTEGHEGTFWDN